MAKNSIRDYSATNSANTDIQSIDISEGCSPAGINNAIREVMADLKDVSTGAVALESPAMDSASLTGNLTFGDNNSAVFGASNDLTINHDGNNSFITDSGTGSLYIQGTSGVFIRSADGGETLAAFTDDGAATLYYDNVAKLATTATGVDVTGTAVTDGLESTCSAGDANQALLAYHPTSTSARTIAKFQSNVGGTQQDKVVIKCDGSVGIGTASPTSGRILDANGQVRFQTSSSGRYFDFINDSAASYLDVSHSLNIRTNGASSLATAMTLTSNGKLCVGTSSAVTSAMLTIQPADTNRIINTRNFNTTTQFHHVFQNSAGTTVGSIQCNNAATAYNTSSDYRLKENVTADWDATTRLKQLNPVRFNFISDADTTVDGFLAHEVQDIVPEAITGTKDAMMDEEYEVSAATGDIYTPAVEATFDEDGVELTAAVDEVIHSADVEQPEELAEGQQWRETTAAVMGTRSVPDFQGIDQSKLVPLLVKTIQELEARISALEAN